MPGLKNIAVSVTGVLPLGVAVLGTLLALWIAHRLLERRARIAEGQRFQKQIAMLALGLFGVLVAIMTLPVSDQLRGQLLTFVGILLSGALALSATTLLGNALAAVMLHAIRGFRMGDFIRVGDHFGRVSERGLFHTEIQTQDRELTTLPNLYLVTHPVTTIRSSGTVVSATLSLGYDVSRQRIEELLLEAARNTELEAPFVQVIELGNYSVTYRIAGLLTDVTRLISARSRLRAAAMDALHRGGVEIVSPTFMNQRVFPDRRKFVPMPPAREAAADASTAPEEIVFDKAEQAEELEQLQLRYKQLDQELEHLRDELKRAGDAPSKERLQREIDLRTAERQDLAATIERRKTAEAAPAL